MANAVVSRKLSVHKEHEVLLKLESAGLGEDEAQAIVDFRDNTLAITLVDIIRVARQDKGILQKIEALLASNKDKASTIPIGKYADEEVESNYTYPKEYQGPRPIGQQVDRLAKLFGLSLGFTSDYIEKVLPTLTLPAHAEGWFAIPSVDALATRFFADVEDPEERYCRAVQLLMNKIASLRSFHNWHEGQITPKHLRLTTATREAFEQIAQVQKGDIWIVPYQLGLKYRGRSIRRARVLFTPDEFGMDALAALAIALTHPERFVRWEELDIDLAGNEWSLRGDGVFENSACMYFNDDKFKFDYRYLGNAHQFFGSGSGFLLRLAS